MIRLDELINEKCSNVVEYKTLDKVCKISKGKQLNKDGLLLSGLYPVINGGIVPSGYWNEFNYNENLVTISQGGASAGYVAYQLTKFWAGAHCYVVESCDNTISYRYLYHFLKEKEQTLQSSQVGAGIPSVSLKEIYGLRIPVPPIEVQEEIARILDKFGKLEAELEAELEARKSQYKFWREKLFDIKKETKTYRLEDVLISLKTGLNPRKFFKVNTEDAEGYYVTVREIGDRNVRYWESKDRVNQEGLQRINARSNLEINDVLFSGTGTIGRVSLIEEKTDNWNVKEGVYILKPKTEIINPIYLMYLMRSSYMKKLYSNYIVGSPVSSVPMRDLKNVEFELPNLEMQKKIISILDKFDKLVNDISEGLPAEIEARRKQYEYYRNNLLSFEELKINE